LVDRNDGSQRDISTFFGSRGSLLTPNDPTHGGSEPPNAPLDTAAARSATGRDNARAAADGATRISRISNAATRSASDDRSRDDAMHGEDATRSRRSDAVGTASGGPGEANGGSDGTPSTDGGSEEARDSGSSESGSDSESAYETDPRFRGSVTASGGTDGAADVGDPTRDPTPPPPGANLLPGRAGGYVENLPPQIPAPEAGTVPPNPGAPPGNGQGQPAGNVTAVGGTSPA
jgi:hypothetical protein